MNMTVKKKPKNHRKRHLISVQALLRDLKAVIRHDKDVRTEKRKENYAGLYLLKKTFKTFH